jgi:SAM-dependent methyltransferase
MGSGNVQRFLAILAWGLRPNGASMHRLAEVPDLATRERAEIVRSEKDALALAHVVLRLPPASVDRYQAPAADTAYPLEYAFHLVGDISGKSVLDLGCGAGENTVCLAHRGARIWALDICEALVRTARRRLAGHHLSGRARVLVGSAHAIPLRTASVDVVFGNAVLHHLDLDRAVIEIGRVLRPGGRAVFREPVRNSPALKQLRRLIPLQWENVSPFERPLTSRVLAEFASRLGPHDSRVFCLPHVRASRLLPFVRDHEAALYTIDRLLLRHVPALRPFAAIEVMAVTKHINEPGGPSSMNCFDEGGGERQTLGSRSRSLGAGSFAFIAQP